MSPDQKPEWFEIADADNATSPRKVAKTIPLLALAAVVAIIGVGTVFAQTQQEPPANAVENATAPATQADPVATTTQPSADPVVVPATSTPAAGSASMERTNPNPSLTVETVSTPTSNEEPVSAPAPKVTNKTEEPAKVPTPIESTSVKAPTPIKAPTIGVKPPKGGEHEGNEHKNSGDHEGEGEDD